jgi:16S rRNA (guanine527-N7)-methyltransferase
MSQEDGTAELAAADRVLPGIEPPPAGAAAVFGDVMAQAEKYADLLASVGVERGIIGPAEAERIWDRHLLNCAAIARLIPAKAAVVDVGSGAGLPGIVLALLLPAARFTLVESMARRVVFLEECVQDLGLPNVEVARGRAEDLAGHLAADVVTARAVAPLDKLAGMCVGLVRPGGKVVAIKGASAEAELTRARPALARLGVTDARVLEVASANGAATATVVAFTAAAEHRPGQSRRRDARAPAGYRGGPPDGGHGRAAGRAGGRASRPNSRRGGG